MLEWKSLSRSIRLERNGYALDVWPVFELFQANNQFCKSMQRGYRFTVFNQATKRYTASGIRLTQDEACEDSLWHTTD